MLLCISGPVVSTCIGTGKLNAMALLLCYLLARHRQLLWTLWAMWESLVLDLDLFAVATVVVVVDLLFI